ncbi:hypothetical protein Hanom_Chr05g00410871 [Helianthus anomalus]
MKSTRQHRFGSGSVNGKPGRFGSVAVNPDQTQLTQLTRLTRVNSLSQLGQTWSTQFNSVNIPTRRLGKLTSRL